MFRGRSTHMLDAKGRLTIPAKFRDVLRAQYSSEGLIITTMPSCLAAYPFEEWRKIEERFSKNSFTTPEIRTYQRFFLAGAVECPIDGQGRVLIPASLRKEAELTKEVVLSGMLTYFEIWSKDKLEKELQKARENFDQYERMVAGLEQ